MYLFIALLTLFWSARKFNQAAGTISIYKPNMMSWIFYNDFILMTLLGAIFVVYQIDNHYMIDKLVYESSRVKGFWAIIYTLVMFPVGMKLGCLVFKERHVDRLFSRYTTQALQMEKKYSDYNVRLLSILLSGVSVLSVIYVLGVLREIPLLKFFSNSAFDFAEFRIDASRNFQGNEYVKNLLAMTLTPLFSYIAYGYKLRDKTLFTKCWFYTMFLFSILILTYNFSKAPVLYYLIGFVFYRVYLKGSISKKMMLMMFLLLLTLIVGMYAVLMAGGDINLSTLFSYNTGILGRLLLSQGAGTFLSFDIFPDEHPFLGFASVSKALSGVLNLEYSEPSARLIMEQINPKGVKMGIAGVANSLFIGEAWANFGLLGVLIAPLYVGFLIQILYLFFLKSRKTPVLMGFFVSFSMQSSITGGFNAYFYNINLLFLLGVFLAIYVLAFIGSMNIKNTVYAQNNFPCSNEVR